MQVATISSGLPVPCYLLQTEDGKNILIDSGLPTDPAILPPNFPQSALGRSVIEQLAMLGLKPRDIDILICTHLDIDHAGNHDAFTNAEFIVQRQQYEVARSGHPRFERHRKIWDYPELRYRLIEGDTEIVPGLTLIETSGHVPGHQSVLLHLHETGPVLLTIDAVALQTSFTRDRTGGPTDLNAEEAIASTRKLLDLAQRERVALIIFGHDAHQWLSLKKAPEYYD
jgi:N-acyl homoserine lactone hydrolase